MKKIVCQKCGSNDLYFTTTTSAQFEALPDYWYIKQTRRHNRQIHKMMPKKGIRKRNQAPYLVHGFRLFDKVQFKGQTGFIFGRRASGSFDIRKLDGTKISPCAGYKKLTLINTRKTCLMERRVRGSSHD